jgi:hypothetical protein
MSDEPTLRAPIVLLDECCNAMTRRIFGVLKLVNASEYL